MADVVVTLLALSVLSMYLVADEDAANSALTRAYDFLADVGGADAVPCRRHTMPVAGLRHHPLLPAYDARR